MRFDKRGKGRLGVEDYYNVLKLQNKLECTKDELKKLCEDLDKDKEDKIAIKVGDLLFFFFVLFGGHWFSFVNPRSLDVRFRTLSTSPSSLRRCSRRSTRTRTALSPRAS